MAEKRFYIGTEFKDTRSTHRHIKVTDCQIVTLPNFLISNKDTRWLKNAYLFINIKPV